MSDPLSAAELLDQLERLSPAALEAEIAELKERTARAERMLKIIKGDPQRRSPATIPSDERTSSEGTNKPAIDKSINPRERVLAFLNVSGPTAFRAILSAVGMMPGPLKELLTGDRAFTFNEADKTWSLKRAA